MTLLSARSLALSYGPTLLLDRISFRLSRGERVALLGRNGAGKSSLLSVIAGHSTADAGELEFGPAVRVAMLEQDVAASLGGSVASIIAGGAKVARIDGIRALDADDPSATERRVSAIISRMSLPGGADFRSLSGGLKRRILLARSLLCEPELLLLDEPTNHLDIESIEWLERQMLAHRGCVLYTTHDRHFLERTATRIIALDRGALSSWPGDYANYLRRRDEILAVETRADAQFDRKLAEEELWIRQGIKARRTRNEGTRAPTA